MVRGRCLADSVVARVTIEGKYISRSIAVLTRKAQAVNHHLMQLEGVRTEDPTPPGRESKALTIRPRSY